MLLPLSWLKEFVEIDVPPQVLQEKLFSCGFEVEELRDLGKEISGIYTGRIINCAKHPDADRLTVCKVDCGEKGERQICTAATNIFEGAVVPCALDGAIVHKENGYQKIKSGKLRGIASEGMFCSGQELGIGDDFYEGAEVDGILILDSNTPIGEDIRKVVGLDDYIFDVSVTANRPDCQSILGLAREVAAVLKKPLKYPDVRFTPTQTDAVISVEVREPKLCPRYLGHYVKDVRIGKSPRWLRRRLALCGLRSVSNMVDITNYVLLEIGQPMHAFDRNFLHGDKIVVRCAGEGEKIITLDQKEFSLRKENLLICDAERAVGIAGVMGGLNSEIKESTKEVFFEAASFARDSVRKTSRALGQRSDSSARFEKGVDPLYTPQLGLNRALHLVEQLGCGVPTSFRADVCSVPSNRKIIKASYTAIDALLGIHIPKEEIVQILKRLEFEVEGDGDTFRVAVPLFREDIEGYPDLAEEVIRIYGYDHLVPAFLENSCVTHGGRSEAQKIELKLKRTIQHQGYLEACSYSFFSPKDFDLLRLRDDAPERHAIRILNPIGEDLSLMRTILAPSMIQNIVRNVRRGNLEGKLFELANVFWAQELPLQEMPEERKTLSLGLWGQGDFFDLKGAIEAVSEAFDIPFSFQKGEKSFLHPGITAIVMFGDKEVGYLGELHPAIAQELALEKQAYLAELNIAALFKKFRKDITYHQIPKFESVKRDLAVVVKEETSCSEVEGCIMRACKAIKNVELFDVYRDLRLGSGNKSLAFRLTFAPDENAEKSLSPEQIERFFHKIVDDLKKNLGAELR